VVSRALRCAAALICGLHLAGCAAATPMQDALRFALMGDTPYSQAQANLLDALIDQANAEPLAFVAHVGDITSGQGPCGDEWLTARQRQFARFKAPFVLLPGDNEWTDCHRGGLDPLERLARWRELFCVDVALAGFRRQAGRHCENVRWEAGGIVFVGVNVPGSNNNVGRNAQMDREAAQRMRAVFAWLDQAERRMDGDKMLVLLMQANPFLRPRGRADGFAELRQRLARLAERHPRRVVLVHGDTHRHRDDEPIPGLRRIEVPGAPGIEWLRASFGKGALSVEPVRP
jgi:hypothetical protein